MSKNMIHREKIEERLQLIIVERATHVANSAYPSVEEHHEYITGDTRASFKDESDARYYERLTGHIEELKYLLLLIGA